MYVFYLLTKLRGGSRKSLAEILMNQTKFTMVVLPWICRVAQHKTDSDTLELLRGMKLSSAASEALHSPDCLDLPLIYVVMASLTDEAASKAKIKKILDDPEQVWQLHEKSRSSITTVGVSLLWTDQLRWPKISCSHERHALHISRDIPAFFLCTWIQSKYCMISDGVRTVLMVATFHNSRRFKSEENRAGCFTCVALQPRAPWLGGSRGGPVRTHPARALPLSPCRPRARRSTPGGPGGGMTKRNNTAEVHHKPAGVAGCVMAGKGVY